ncbi:MAG TPA: hypothetical protein G4O11_11480 [Anaerolineae bacterium]|nr:hypothetical protein [Anaerolineae bacterium]
MFKESRTDTRSQQLRVGKTIFLFFVALLGIMAFGRAMQLTLSHDEHQFVASAELLSKHSFLPFVDYAYFHMPHLVFIYALIFQFTDYLLLGARAFEALCMVGIAFLVGHLAMIAYREFSSMIRVVVGVAAAAIFIFNPITAYTGGRAWNHDLPILLTLLASCLLLNRQSRSTHSDWRSLLIGFLLGIATGVRLSFAVALVPFGIYLLLDSKSIPLPRRLKQIILLGTGSVLGLLPSIAIFAIDPMSFIFGNYSYQTLNTSYYVLIQIGQIMVPLGKVAYFGHSVLSDPGNGLLFIGLVLIVPLTILVIKRNRESRQSLNFLCFMAFFLFISAFGPTPTHYQYFYASIPFVVLTVVYALESWLRVSKVYLWACLLYVALMVGLSIDLPELMNSVMVLSNFQQAVPIAVHSFGDRLKSVSPEGKVLTLAPIFPLEGGLDIYEDFATGPFMWRTAPLLTESKREQYRVISQYELDELLEVDQPSLLLTGLEDQFDGFNLSDIGGLEVPIDIYASDHGYQVEYLSTSFVSNPIRLWTR